MAPLKQVRPIQEGNFRLKPATEKQFLGLGPLQGAQQWIGPSKITLLQPYQLLNLQYALITHSESLPGSEQPLNEVCSNWIDR